MPHMKFRIDRLRVEDPVTLMELGSMKTVHRHDRANCAYLNVWNDEPKLNSNRNDNANPNYGSVVFVRDCRQLKRPLAGRFDYAFFLQPPSIRPIPFSASDRLTYVSNVI